MGSMVSVAAIFFNDENDARKFTIKDLYDVLPKNAPANENVKREPQEYSIGPYTSVVEGTDNEE